MLAHRHDIVVRPGGGQRNGRRNASGVELLRRVLRLTREREDPFFFLVEAARQNSLQKTVTERTQNFSGHRTR